MASKSAKCDKNGVKIAVFFAAKSQKFSSGWGLGPHAPGHSQQIFNNYVQSVTRFSCISLFSTEGKSGSFAQKDLVFVYPS